MKPRLLALFASAAVLALSSTLAHAADLPRRRAPPVAPMAPAPAPVFAPVPVFTWTGAYVGLNAGWGWNNNDNNNGFFGGGTNNYTVPLLGGGVATYSLTTPNTFFGNGGNDNGFVGGAQVGYNFQMPGSAFVFGVEADIQGVWNDDDNNNGFFGTGPTLYRVAPTAAGVTGTGFGVAPVRAGARGNLALFEQGGAFGPNGLDWFGTLRLRAGVAFDRLLVYATGGLAFGEGNNNNVFLSSSGNSIPAPFFVSPAAAAAGLRVNNGGGIFDNNNDIRWGWTLGAGLEYAFTSNLTLKLEGLYVNLDQNNNIFGGGDIAGVTNTGAPVRRSGGGFVFNNDNNADFFVVRGGLNFKFNTF